MMFMQDRGQREADEFAERMQRELEAGRSAESRDEMSYKALEDAWFAYRAAVVQLRELTAATARRDTWSDMDAGFHPKHTFGRRGNF